MNLINNLYLNKNELFLIGNYFINEMWTSNLLVPFPGERSDGTDMSRSCVAVVRPYNTEIQMSDR